MASGWANDGAVQDQIDSTVEDAVARARRDLPRGESLAFCEMCDEPIPEARRKAIPGVRLCVNCQQKRMNTASATPSITAAARKTASSARPFGGPHTLFYRFDVSFVPSSSGTVRACKEAWEK